MKKKRNTPCAPRRPVTYSVLDEMMASPTQPMPAEKQRHQMTRMLGGLDELARAERPSKDAWRVCSDAVNLLETLVLHGPWPDCDGGLVDVQDASGLLEDAVAALAQAGNRVLAGQPMRLSGAGLTAVRAVLQDYQSVLGVLPARTMVRCHRATEQRMHQILDRIKHLPDGVHVMAI